MAALPYLLPYLVPLFVLTGYWTGAAWAFRSVTWFFLAALALEFVAGADTRNREQSLVHPLERSVLRLATWAWTPLHAAMIAAGLMAVHDREANVFAVAVALGTAGGMFGIPVAHELVHRCGRFERALAEIQMTMFSYAHFCIEHVEGHHTNVGTAMDPATARFGESIYAFLPRSILGGVASAWRLESARLRRKGRPPFSIRNRMLRYFSLTLTLYLLIAAFFGPRGVALFALQSFVSFGIIEVINYIEHYGLVRRELSSGRFESVLPAHSWDASRRISNWLLFNVPRHSHHHLEPARLYPFIPHSDGSPQLPAGYLAMFILALFPPLWRRVMHPLMRLP